MSDILTFAQVDKSHADLVGGKGLSLGLTASAGLPVPDGFCVTSTAYRRHSATQIDAPLFEAIQLAYRNLGGGLVAVRSSATAEDGAVTSFAGQQETILGVDGEGRLRDAIERCWRSLHTDRARAYREKQGVAESGLAMAVVVQRLINADVAGVLFTRDPLDAGGSLMRIEAAWGLGEVVVSGRVTPDRFQVERDTGVVRQRQAGHKHVRVTRHGDEAVAADRQRELCLSDHEIALLADLGRKVETFYGDARDIEWAIADGKVWLLQARPITTAGADDRERVRRETINRLTGLVEPGGTIWSRTNLIEVLAEPTPMTWSVVSSKLLSGGGGTGAMYRDFGFQPEPALAATSAYDLIGGRPFMNLSREPRLESAKPMAGYPLAKYKQSPHLALDPKRDSPRGLRKWLGLIAMIRMAAKVAGASKAFADEFRNTHIPAFNEQIAKWNADDVSRLESSDLVRRFYECVERTLVDFSRQSLKPTLLAQFSWQVLEQQIAKALGNDRARTILTELSGGAKPDAEADLAGGIRALADQRMTRDEFLARFGHRGPNEMELSSPRWIENPALLSRLASSSPTHVGRSASDTLTAVAGEAKWNSMVVKSMTGHVERLQSYLGLRETGKHHLMRGYMHIRKTLLELDGRFDLEGGIFYLTPDELPALVAGNDFKQTIAGRRKTRAVELGLEIPAVLFGDDLDAIGRPLPPPADAEEFAGVPLSAGTAEGPALVLTEPSTESVEAGYILVCPSTDPAWVPLFVNARGLVMESGGTLSHGAIVAREFGLPAVAGLPGIQHRLRTGQRVRVDGSRGTVTAIDR
ncbi:MAG TPA: PEP/pyruvate-binding domain-containing protein [Gemmataceae bacterium]|jgi:pyruvate,water dikinase|nr:PEP/pyruvate-binding domain-containing protein [Gemmataceae bacterium]